jgi:hypothetical protein
MAIGLFLISFLLEVSLNDGRIAGVNLYLDNVLTGLLAGGMVFWYEQRRHRVLLDRMRVIAGMNHHVRNALQAIALASHADHATQIQIIDEAARRIQWALREVLPGEVEIVADMTADTMPNPRALRRPNVG